MNKNLLSGIAATTFVASLAFAAPASAAVTFDSATGAGFVGKGDVQLAFGWNNAQLKQHAGEVQFAVERTAVTELSWECTKPVNGKSSEKLLLRQLTTTTSTSTVVDKVTRDNKKQDVTGFELVGYAGEPTVLSTITEAKDGDEAYGLNTCPGQFGLTQAADPQNPVVVSESGTLKVSHDINKVDLLDL